MALSFTYHDRPIELVQESHDILIFYRDYPEQTRKTLICRAYYPPIQRHTCRRPRGDFKVEFDKVSTALGLDNIRLANPDKMQKLGMVVGYVSPIDCSAADIEVFGDRAINRGKSYYDGANKGRIYRKSQTTHATSRYRGLLDMAS